MNDLTRGKWEQLRAQRLTDPAMSLRYERKRDTLIATRLRQQEAERERARRKALPDEVVESSGATADLTNEQ